MRGYNLSFNKPENFSTSKSTTSVDPNIFPARVVEVILDGDDSEIGAVYYRPLNKVLPEIDQRSYVAYPLNKNVTIFPLKNEVVIIQIAPSITLGTDSSSTRAYYTTVLNLWDTPHYNGYPDQTQNPGDADTGEYFKERADVNPLQPFPGDLLLQGRQGQSIRMTGVTFPENPWTTTLNNGKPLLILSNGQTEAETGYEHIVEDINRDASSIYFTSDHFVDLNPATLDRRSYPENRPPVDAASYKGAQLVLNSGRIYLNARDESAFISSKVSIGLNASSVNIEGSNYVTLDGDRIYIGAKSMNDVQLNKEPALLGNQVESFLSDLLDMLQGTAVALGASTDPVLIERGKSMLPVIKMLRGRISPSGKPSQLKSTKVYIDPGKK